MDHAEVFVELPPDEVWAALVDASALPEWLVGCQEIRHVEGDWPEPGSAVHHCVGVGAATIEDTTTVLEMEKDRRLVLRARARPAGVATVAFTLTALDGGTQVVMEEAFVEGPASRAPDFVTDPLLHPRNASSLRQLKRLAEDRAGARDR